MSGSIQPTNEEVAQRVAQLIAGYGWQTVRAGAVAAWVHDWRVAGGLLDGPAALDRVCLRAAAVQLYAGVQRARRLAPSAAGRPRAVDRDLKKYLTAVAARLHQPPPEGRWDRVVRATVTALAARYEECVDPQLFLAWAVSLLSEQRQQAVRARLGPAARASAPSGAPTATPASPNTPPPSVQERALLQQYIHTAEPAIRAQILRQLVQDLTPAARTAGRARLQAWVADLPPPDLVGSPAYARYRQLLPQVLAGWLDPQDGASLEFGEFLDEWDAYREEYQDLAQAMATGANPEHLDSKHRSSAEQAEAEI